MVCGCCWRKKKEKLHSATRLKRSRSLEKVNLGKYTSLILEDKYQPEQNSVYRRKSTDQSVTGADNTTDQGVTGLDNFIMGNSLSPESLDSPRDNPLKKTESSVSLKSSSSVKSSSSRRSKVTFNELNPEVHMIPPKSPPKPKRTRNNKPNNDDVDILIKDDESESAFQFDLSNKAEMCSIEDLSGYKSNSKKTKRDKTADGPKVKKIVFCVYLFSLIFSVFSLNNNYSVDAFHPLFISALKYFFKEMINADFFPIF